jgi:hypothetical protein
MNKNQKGVGFISLILTIAVAAFLVICGLKIGSGYVDRNIIKKTVSAVLIETKNKDNSESSIKKSITERVSVNNIRLDADDIIVTTSNSGYNIQVNYTKTIKLNSDISIVMNFLIEDTTL